MTARALMVWGCTSDAGKSFLATALCRWYADQGLRVAPFKAQNMSNNARVVDGGEIGCAQWFQAMAARKRPEVRHNPVLLKPESDTRSQVVVMGQVDRELSSMDWRGRSALLWERARGPLRELMEENDLVVMEGAGSPAEINLAGCDFANLHSAREAKARCLLVSDIDRGGSFAHLHGTWALLPEDLRGSLDGFVLNKFRGNPDLLAPGPARLAELTGVDVVGVVPRVAHQLPDEDAVALEQFVSSGAGPVRHRVGIVAWPRISNFDEFRRLAAWPGVETVLVRQRAQCAGLDLLILPGSKNAPADIDWLRDRGLDRAIHEHAHAGRPVLGVCGGLQALGGEIIDSCGTEGEGRGLGLLDLRTVHGEVKRVGALHARIPAMDGFWHSIGGLDVSGYQIRTGATEGCDPLSSAGLFVSSGNVLGTYLHGMLEDPSVLGALFGVTNLMEDPLESTFREMGELVENHLDREVLEAIVTGAASPRRKAPAPRLAVLTGGVRAGKSSAAQELSMRWGGGSVTVIATAEGLDEEMRLRIRAHQADRPTGWETIEEPMDVPGAIRLAKGRVVLLDCLNLWITNLLLSPAAPSLPDAVDALIAAFREAGKDLVVVTNEVGWGIVPDNALSREFRDQLGWANQKLVASSTEAWLYVAGARIPLKANHDS
ncbi:MAG: cobyric acid synthase [Fibrobacteres bacterium]|nr:cobyric acid synthase [Fibrobacterota bacterium]